MLMDGCVVCAWEMVFGWIVCMWMGVGVVCGWCGCVWMDGVCGWVCRWCVCWLVVCCGRWLVYVWMDGVCG